jgi:hypothetical protein
VIILTECPRKGKELQDSADQPPQVFPLGMAEMDRMVDGLSPAAKELNLLTRIHGGRKDHFLEKVPAHVVGAGEGEQEASLPEETKSLKIEVLVSS